MLHINVFQTNFSFSIFDSVGLHAVNILFFYKVRNHSRSALNNRSVGEQSVCVCEWGA